MTDVPPLVRICFRLAGLPADTSWADAVPRLIAAGVYLPCAKDDPDRRRAEGFVAAGQERQRLLSQVSQTISKVAKDVQMGGWWLKGWAARSLYPAPEMRLMADLDLLLADAVQVEKLASALQEHGYVRQPQATPWPANFELPLLAPEKVLVELHRSLGPPIFGDRLGQPEAQDGLRPLPPDWQIAHACLHCYQHAGRLKAYQWLDSWFLAQNEENLAGGIRLLSTRRLNAVLRFYQFHFAGNLGKTVGVASRGTPWRLLYDGERWRFPLAWRGPKIVVVVEDRLRSCGRFFVSAIPARLR